MFLKNSAIEIYSAEKKNLERGMTRKDNSIGSISSWNSASN